MATTTYGHPVCVRCGAKIMGSYMDFGTGPVCAFCHPTVVSWAEIAALKAEVESMAAKNQHLRATLIDLRMQYHAAGRRPEECHEMSMIDEALRMAMRNADTGEAE